MCIKEIKGFRGQYSFLSNFSSYKVTYKGITYNNNESAFQAQKTEDDNVKKEFVNLPPVKAKSKGRRVKLRSDWEKVKDNIMYEIVLAKFQQNEDIKQILLATGDAYLEETNTWKDKYWGVCNGEGKNMLGKILMCVRQELRESLNTNN